MKILADLRLRDRAVVLMLVLVACTAGGAQADPRPRDDRRATALSVDPSNREESLRFFWDNYTTSSSLVGWHGDIAACNAGTLDPLFTGGVLRRINYYRAMAGVPGDIVFDPAYNRMAQQAALMMEANNQLDHSPPTNWRCYTAEGALAASKSNLALGAYGPDAVDLYMRDTGTYNAPVPHRRWLLYPNTRKMGSGDLPSANALWVLDPDAPIVRPPTRDGFVAWPPPGFVPFRVVFARWSLSDPRADFSAAQVSMTQSGTPVPIVVESRTESYGEPTIAWRIASMTDGQRWARPAADTPYTVEIANVLINGAPQTLRYTVTVIDDRLIQEPSVRLFLPVTTVRR